VGLSSEKTEMKRNVRLLKEPSWLDISIEKGPPGEHAFLEAFAEWERRERKDKP
jgi:hypothetical protein